MRRRIAIIGGGITGLAAANRLLELDPAIEIMLLDRSDRLGGVLQTTRQDGFLLEGAADGFLATPPWALDFCRRIGCSVVPTDAPRPRAFVVHRGRLQPVPPGFVVMAPRRLRPVLSSPLLSVRGKLRIALEPFVPARHGRGDESIASFVRRRFGREVYDHLVQPLVGGIYSGDPETLSLEATMPRFREMERKHGSLLRAMWEQPTCTPSAEPSGARYGQFVAPRAGMSDLVEGAARCLAPRSIRLNSPVAAVRPLEGGRWRLEVQGDAPGFVTANGLILAAPAFESARLLAPLAPAAAKNLRDVSYAGCAIVSLGYRREQVGHPLDGLGFVVPRVEDRLILSCSFSSAKYPGRAPEGEVLLRVFIGGAHQGHLLALSEAELVELARLELTDLLGLRGDPLLAHVSRRSAAMPQYQVGHCERVRQITSDLERFPSLVLAGSGLFGVGIPHCIRSGEEAAGRVLRAARPQRELAAAV